MVQYQGIVACSGGPDSMALLAKLCNKKVIVAHVNYHKRDTADRDEQIVRNFCDQHHLPLFVYAPKSSRKLVTFNLGHGRCVMIFLLSWL